MAIGTISREELKQKIDRKDNFHLVEALAPEKFNQAHLPTAINIPYDRVRELAPQLLPDKNAEIVTYCAAATWHASEVAARELAAMGYTNIREYGGGKQDWIGAGLPMHEGGRDEITGEPKVA